MGRIGEKGEVYRQLRQKLNMRPDQAKFSGLQKHHVAMNLQ